MLKKNLKEVQTKNNRLLGTDYFFRNHPLSRIQEHISYNFRRKAYQHWKKMITDRNQSTCRVLDVGSTPDCKRKDSNCLVKWLVSDGYRVSLFSVESISHLKDLGVDSILLSVDSSSRIPADDKSYDWVFLSAVLEHAGSSEEQSQLLSECVRIAAKGVFVTTPNRWHWLEFHTKLPLLHWLPKPIHRTIIKIFGMGFWALEKNLNLLSCKDLDHLSKKVFPSGFKYHIKKFWFLGMPSNLVLIGNCD